MKKSLFNLQWFAGEGTAAEGTATAEAGENAATEGVGTREEPNIRYGKQPEPVQEKPEQPQEDAGEDDGAKYKQFKEQFKEQYQADLQRVIDKRFKNAKQVEAQKNALQSENDQYKAFAKVLKERFGTDDIEQLTAQLTSDKEWREEQALKEGLTLEAYDKVHAANQRADKLQGELDAMNAQKEQEVERAIQTTWEKEGEDLKELYPDFDFQREVLENEKFGFALSSGLSVRDAYQYAHFDEILSGVIHYSAQQAKEAVSASREQRARRPVENGARAGAAAIVKSDVNKLTKEDMENIDRRVLRGEKISF